MLDRHRLRGGRYHDIALLEGDTGVIRSTLTLEGDLATAPAVYGDKLVIVVNVGDDGRVCCVHLAGEPGSGAAEP